MGHFTGTMILFILSIKHGIFPSFWIEFLQMALHSSFYAFLQAKPYILAGHITDTVHQTDTQWHWH